MRTLHLLLTIIVLLPSFSWAGYRLQKSGIPIIEKLTTSLRGRDVELYELDQMIQDIVGDGLFQVVYVESLKGNRVVIRAEGSMLVDQIDVSGNITFSSDQIVEIAGLEKGKTYSQLEITQAIDRIEESYRSSGFYNFTVRYEQRKVKKGSLLAISINERQACLIEDITIFSKNRRLRSRLLPRVQSFIMEGFQEESTNRIEESIVDYLLSHRYLTAKVTNSATVFNGDKTRVKLSFTVENPTQFEFIFNGNEHFSHFDLIKVSKVGRKFLYLNDSSSEILDNISNYYRKSGFPRAQVFVTEQPVPKESKKILVFEINEGPRVKISSVSVGGKISKPRSYYNSLFLDFLGDQENTVYFVKENIEKTVEALISHLKREGHLMAEVLALDVKINEFNEAVIDIQIDEGILTYVRQILFRGSKSFSNVKLREIVEIEPNKPLRIEEVEESFDKLSEFYQNKAYLEFQIKNRNASVIQYTEGQPYADLVYQVREGPKIRVSSITTNGNTKTKDYVLIRELDFTEGDFLTLDRVSNSITQLERTGLFGKVNIRSLDQGSEKQDRAIVIEVEERKPGLFSSGIGILNEGVLTYRGYVGMLYNNLWGKARGLSSRVDLKYRERVKYIEHRVALSYYEPYIFKNRVRGRISLVREQETSFINTNNLADIRSTNQIRLSTEKDFSRHFRFTYNVWEFSNQETFTAQTLESQGTVNIASTGPILEFDYRNDPFLPTDGSYTRFELEYADPLFGSSRDRPNVTGFNPATNSRYQGDNEVNFFKTTFATTHYTPITKSKRFVWTNSLRGGFLKNVSERSDSGVPRVESFFLGGSSTIRGFTFGTSETVPGQRELCLAQGLIALGEPTSGCQFDDIFVRKDSIYFLIKSELRFPISGNFGGLVFYDGGAVYLGGIKLQDPYRDSVGFGFSYDTPVGSFVIQFGYKLDRKIGGLDTKYDQESDFAIHLAIGTF